MFRRHTTGNTRMTGASRALLPSWSNTCNSLSVVLGRPRVVPLREDCNRRRKQMQSKQAWQAPTSGSPTLAGEPTQHISNTYSSSHKSSDQQQCSEARPVPSFRACACYKNVFFFSRPHLPREHCRVRAARKNEEDGLRASDRAPATGMQDKKLQHGAPTVAGAWDFLPWRSCGTRPYRASFLWDFFPRNSLHQFRCFGG